MKINTNSLIYVAGHKGLAGSALLRRLRSGGYNNILTRTHQELDLVNQAAVNQFMLSQKPDYIFLAAAKVGGINANNTYPADFIYQNLAIEVNVIHAAHLAGVDKLMFLGSSCIYPRDCPQPIRESYLLTGALEPTSEPYGIAKIAGLKLCESYNRQYGRHYVSVMPTNLYGPFDNYDLENSHVLSALMRKMHESKINNDKTITVWGTGTPKREFLHADDMADACIFLMEQESPSGIYNVGTGEDIRISELAELLKSIVDYNCEIAYDESMPDGTPQKLSDVSRLSSLGWRSKIQLEEGLKTTYQWYIDH